MRLKVMKNLWLILILLTVASAPLRAEIINVDSISAIVNEAIITRDQVYQYILQALVRIQEVHRNNPREAEKAEGEIFKDGLTQLVENQLILDDFKRSGFSLPESIIEDRIREQIRVQFRDRANMTKTLKEQEGITIETYRHRIRDNIIIEEMRHKNISAAVLISPQKIESYYVTNLNNYKLGEQIKLRTIVLKRNGDESMQEVKKLASEIQSKIEQGASFAEMASVYSAGSQRKDGGDWGWIERTVLNKGLSDIAFGMNSGQRSPLIAIARQAGQSGYWIYQYAPEGQIVLARNYSDKDAFVQEKDFRKQPGDPTLPEPVEFYLMLVENKQVARIKPLPEVREQIEKDLLVQEHNRLYKKWIDRLKTKSLIEYPY
ncbi:MAG TPA: peptidylprolyl isomerase [Verrucomicrobiae bacterium]